MLPLQSPNIKWTKSVEHPLLYPFNFCSTVFVPQFLFCYFCSAIFVLQLFVPLFLFHWPFCTCTWGPHHPMAESPHQFLFRNFCSADLFALALTNFCSAIFVPLTFLHLHLGSSSPNGQESPPSFVQEACHPWHILSVVCATQGGGTLSWSWLGGTLSWSWLGGTLSWSWPGGVPLS